MMLLFAVARGHLRRVIEALVETQGSSLIAGGEQGALRHSGLVQNRVLHLYGKTLWRCVVSDPDPNTLKWVNTLVSMPPSGTATNKSDRNKKRLRDSPADSDHMHDGRAIRLPEEMWLPLERSARAATDLFLTPEVMESILGRV